MNVTNPFLVESINNAIIKENIRSFDSDSVSAKRSEDQMNNAVQNIDDLISQTSLSFDNTRDENDVNIVLTSSSSHEGDDLLKSLLEVNNGALGSQNKLWPSSLELELSSKYAGEDELGKDSNQLNLIEKTTESKEIFSSISEQKPSKVETNLVTDAKPIFPFENRTNSTSNDQPKHKLTEQPSKPSEGIGNTLSDLDTLCTSQSKEKAALDAPKEVTPVEEESQAKSEETQEKSPETQAKSQDSEEKSQETEEKSQETPEKSQETHLLPEISHGPEDSPSKIRRSSLNSQSWPSLQSLDQQDQPSFGDLLSPSSRLFFCRHHHQFACQGEVSQFSS
ncbi:dentin matrix acidic phosphoprotein 1-like [Diaphorina citri]|uniref:Dentin matrix acidic phosphoprotein 1-like n=1 Tax=Diaphorina citri TaxID=121845 RepID=A0A1S3DRQ5_DIACI|nr:dentin matrix acidic phosphoprotein 1-like [Diaphorina citri]